MRRDVMTLQGALALGAVVLLLALVVIGWSWAEGVLPALPGWAWLGIALVFSLLVSLEGLLVRDYLRLRRPSCRSAAGGEG